MYNIILIIICVLISSCSILPDRVTVVSTHTLTNIISDNSKTKASKMCSDLHYPAIELMSSKDVCRYYAGGTLLNGQCLVWDNISEYMCIK